MTKLIHPITSIDKLIKKNELGQPFKLMDNQREILRLAFAFDQDGLPWDFTRLIRLEAERWAANRPPVI